MMHIKAEEAALVEEKTELTFEVLSRYYNINGIDEFESTFNDIINTKITEFNNAEI